MDTITTTESLLRSNGSAQPVMVALTPSESRLIAAAPCLLEALTVARALLVMTGHLAGMGPVEDSPFIAEIDAAIAKATTASSVGMEPEGRNAPSLPTGDA